MKVNKKWTDEEVHKLSKLRGLKMTINEISRELYRPVYSIEMKLKSLARGTDHQCGILMPDYHQDINPEELLKYVVKGQDLVRRADPREREVFPEYKTNKWVGVVVGGDWHFEHYQTDLEALVADLEAIGKEEDVFYVFNGDVGDWGDVRFKTFNMPSVLLPIQLRYKIVYHLISKIRNLLAVTSGCHDDWVKNRAYFDIIEAIKNKRNYLGLSTYYLGYGGVIHFRVGNSKYKIAVHHKFRGESQINIFHPCMKYLQTIDPNVDVVCIAHRHDKMGISYQYLNHQPRVFIRSGSHQYITDYAWKEGFGGAVARTPMLLLNGERKEMIACADYREGIDRLKSLNK